MIRPACLFLLGLGLAPLAAMANACHAPSDRTTQTRAQACPAGMVGQVHLQRIVTWRCAPSKAGPEPVMSDWREVGRQCAPATDAPCSVRDTASWRDGARPWADCAGARPPAAGGGVLASGQWAHYGTHLAPGHGHGFLDVQCRNGTLVVRQAVCR